MPIITRGDDLPALRGLQMFSPQTHPHSSVTLVWSCDLRTLDKPGTSRQELKRQARAALEASTHVSGLERILIVYVRPPSIPSDRLLAAAERFTERLEAQLERAHGRRVEVLALDVTACNDPSAFNEKVWDHCAHSTHLDGTALDWSELEDTSIRNAVRSLSL